MKVIYMPTKPCNVCRLLDIQWAEGYSAEGGHEPKSETFWEQLEKETNDHISKEHTKEQNRDH